MKRPNEKVLKGIKITRNILIVIFTIVICIMVYYALKLMKSPIYLTSEEKELISDIMEQYPEYDSLADYAINEVAIPEGMTDPIPLAECSEVGSISRNISLYQYRIHYKDYESSDQMLGYIIFLEEKEL